MHAGNVLEHTIFSESRGDEYDTFVRYEFMTAHLPDAELDNLKFTTTLAARTDVPRCAAEANVHGGATRSPNVVVNVSEKYTTEMCMYVFIYVSKTN